MCSPFQCSEDAAVTQRLTPTALTPTILTPTVISSQKLGRHEDIFKEKHFLVFEGENQGHKPLREHNTLGVSSIDSTNARYRAL